jgi:aromatic ring-cleaving dioxygenase
MAYTVVAIHQGSDSWARQAFAAVRARLKSRLEHAARGAVPHDHLVYESADLDPAPGDLLAWVVADRGLSTTLIQAVTPALETP